YWVPLPSRNNGGSAMSRCSPGRRVTLVLAGVLLLPMANAQPPDAAGPSYWRAERNKQTALLRAQLPAPVPFGGFDDPETKLGDVLQYLERAYGIAFTVNDKAFKDDKVENVREHAIAKAIPKMTNVSLNTVLRALMERFPVEGGTTWLVRDGQVEL